MIDEMDIKGPDFAAYAKQMDRLKDDEQRIKKILFRLGDEMVRILKRETPVARGKLRDSTRFVLHEPRYEQGEDGQPIRNWKLVIEQTQKAYYYGTQRFAGALGVQKDKYYGDILQVGTEPHIPPLLQIMQWSGIKFRYNIGRLNTYLAFNSAVKQAAGGSGKVANPITLSKEEQNQLKHIKAIAFGVIGKRGVKQNPYDQVALTLSTPYIDEAVNLIQGVIVSKLAHEKKSHVSYVHVSDPNRQTT